MNIGMSEKEQRRVIEKSNDFYNLFQNLLTNAVNMSLFFYSADGRKLTNPLQIQQEMKKSRYFKKERDDQIKYIMRKYRIGEHQILDLTHKLVEDISEDGSNGNAYSNYSNFWLVLKCMAIAIKQCARLSLKTPQEVVAEDRAVLSTTNTQWEKLPIDTQAIASEFLRELYREDSDTVDLVLNAMHYLRETNHYKNNL